MRASWRPPGSPWIGLRKKVLLVHPGRKGERAGWVLRSPPAKPYKSSVLTNIRRKSDALVDGFLTREAWSTCNHRDPCQDPSCPHHLLQSTTWSPSKPTFLQPSDLGTSESTCLDQLDLSIKFLLISSKSCWSLTQSMKLPFIFLVCTHTYCPLSIDLVYVLFILFLQKSFYLS